MTTAAQYRQYAEECLTAMRAALIPEVQAALFTAAQRWIEEADRAQRSEDDKPPPAAVRRKRTSDEAGAPAQT